MGQWLWRSYAWRLSTSAKAQDPMFWSMSSWWVLWQNDQDGRSACKYNPNKTDLFPSRSSVLIYIYMYIYALLYEFCFLWFTNCVLHSDDNSLMLVTFDICFKQHFDTRYLVFYSPSPPRMFLSLDLLSEYRIQHGAIGPLYVSSSYSTWIFCRGVSGFATDYPCGVWCRRLTTCLLYVGPPWENRFLNTSWAVGLTHCDSISSFFLYFDICSYICLDTSYHFFGFIFTS